MSVDQRSLAFHTTGSVSSLARIEEQVRNLLRNERERKQHVTKNRRRRFGRINSSAADDAKHGNSQRILPMRWTNRV
jgi:hypothetical protein